jgi:hypothetical protein
MAMIHHKVLVLQVVEKVEILEVYKALSVLLELVVVVS